jgi:hypothetical protein
MPQRQRRPTPLSADMAAHRPHAHHHPSHSPTSATSTPPIMAKMYAHTIHRSTPSPSWTAPSPVTTGPRASRSSGIAYPASRHVHHAAPSFQLLSTSSSAANANGHPITAMTRPASDFEIRGTNSPTRFARKPDRTAERLPPTGNEADRTARGLTRQLRKAEQTEDKRPKHRTQSDRQRFRPAPHPHDSARGRRRRHAQPATSVGRQPPLTSEPPPPRRVHLPTPAALPSLPPAGEESHEASVHDGAARRPCRNPAPLPRICASGP